MFKLLYMLLSRILKSKKGTLKLNLSNDDHNYILQVSKECIVGVVAYRAWVISDGKMMVVNKDAANLIVISLLNNETEFADGGMICPE